MVVNTNQLHLYVDAILAQPKDENTLMLHMTICIAIRFSMKYLESSYANFNATKFVRKRMYLPSIRGQRPWESRNRFPKRIIGQQQYGNY